MLKIKDDVDLEELEKFGFKFASVDDYDFYFKKVYLKNDNDDRVCYRILDNGISEIEIVRLDGELDDTLYDLIQAGLVEKDKE